MTYMTKDRTMLKADHAKLIISFISFIEMILLVIAASLAGGCFLLAATMISTAIDLSEYTLIAIAVPTIIAGVVLYKIYKLFYEERLTLFAKRKLKPN
jgi:hypothetical protein